MATEDTCCTIVPYFTVAEGQIGKFRELSEKFVAKTRNEPKCLYYGFSFLGDSVHCREGYEDADSLLNHLSNVGELLKQAFEISEVSRLEIHGPETELAKLRGPLAGLQPQFYVLESGFRR